MVNVCVVFNAARAITLVSPINGTAAGGFLVVVSGWGLANGTVSDLLYVSLGANVLSSVTFVSHTQVRGIAPAAPSGGNVTVGVHSYSLGSLYLPAGFVYYGTCLLLSSL